MSFVHEGDLVLFFRVKAPAELSGEPLRFAAQVRWLACRELCFVGSAEPELELTSAAEPERASPATLKLLATHQARLPRPFQDLGPEASTEWVLVEVAEGERERFLFRLELPEAAGLEFFAGPQAPLETVGQVQEQAGRGRRLEVELAQRPGSDPQPPRIRGVLCLEKDGQVAYFALDLAPPIDSSDER